MTCDLSGLIRVVNGNILLTGLSLKTEEIVVVPL
jgi:hypothetical protein